MIHEVQARLLFANEDEARDFYHDCELALAKSTLINADQENIEFGIIELIENNHDQDPNQLCQVIQSDTANPEH